MVANHFSALDHIWDAFFIFDQIQERVYIVKDHPAV